MLLALIPLTMLASQPAATDARTGQAEEACRDIVGGTGGRHLIRTICPERDKDLKEGLALMERNRLEAGRRCQSGVAYLRSGGRVDHPADHICTCPPSSPAR